MLDKLIVPRYEAWSCPYTRKAVAAYIDDYIPRGSRVLDFGAGRGEVSRYLCSRGYEVEAVDIVTMDGEAFEGVTTFNADLNQPVPRDDASYDAVVAEDVLVALENPWAALRELGRLVRPDGHAIISVDNVNHVFARATELISGVNPYYAQHKYQSGSLITPLPLWNIRRMANEAGFDLVAHRYSMNYVPGLRVRIPLPTTYSALGKVLVLAFRRRKDGETPSAPVRGGV